VAAIVRDEREDVLDPSGLRALATREAFEQVVDELGFRVLVGKKHVALAQVGRLQLDQALLIEVLERRQDAAALLTSSAAASSGASVVQVRPVLPVATTPRRKPARNSSKRPKISSSDASPSGRNR
jgi:hypothetical protein